MLPGGLQDFRGGPPGLGARPGLDGGGWRLACYRMKRVHLAGGLAALGLLGTSAAEPLTRESLVQAVLDRYPGFSLAEKQAAVAGLATRADSAAQLLEALAAGTIA